ncbi:unnamed protein product [Prorocentrum cordatum]|uniref:Uncharacterized protein n=1 Tax=Prorocentrum cordatum TaxID=2364126 RepID=A0ABN9TBG4_9DINO|nr:unnamed protein product [Polarella glacialis]
MGGGEGDCCPGPGGGGRCSADVRVEDLLASGPSSSAHGHAEDPEDSYDWYTFPRAMEALAADPHARAALATMACALAAGAAGGTVPNQWGGVFGQEWTARAFSMLPGPPLKLEPSGCTIASLLAASADAGGRDTGVEGGVAEEDPEAAMGEPPSKRPRAEPGGAAA